jgi:hypothetical protein
MKNIRAKLLFFNCIAYRVLLVNYMYYRMVDLIQISGAMSSLSNKRDVPARRAYGQIDRYCIELIK